MNRRVIKSWKYHAISMTIIGLNFVCLALNSFNFWNPFNITLWVISLVLLISMIWFFKINEEKVIA